MPFQPGQSGNLNGRPRGSRNRTTIALRALIDEEAEEIIRVLAAAARNGNVTAAKALLDRVLPPVRSGFAEAEIPLTPELPLTAAADAVIQAVSDGTLAPGDAVQIGTLLKIRAELTGLAELEQRLAKLETELKEHK
jgi:Family of unknown function (DUF5681)